MSNQLISLIMSTNRKTLFIAVALISIVAVGAVIGILKLGSPSYEVATVQRGTVVQEVSASGKVESPIKIDLHFRNSGKLTVLNTKIGRAVVAGQLLAKQDTSELDAQAREMQAGIDLQKAKLNQLLGGALGEDIQLAEIKLDNSRRKLYSDNLIAVSDIESRRSIVPLVTGSYNGTQEGHYELFFSDLNDLYNRNKVSFTGLEKGNADKDDVPQALGTKGIFITFPEAKYQPTDRWTIEIPNRNGSNYVANLNVYNSAQAELALKKAPARTLDTAVYQAQINQAEASLQKIEAKIAELTIRAPLSSTVTEINGEVGENVGSDKTIVSLAAGNSLQIKLNVVEDNIVNVRVGQETRMTFDSIGKEEFLGRVVDIDPAGTIIGGAVYYNTTIFFNEKDERIRSGMTANVWIRTAASEDTLFVPASAIQNRNGTKVLQILEGKQVIDKEVTTGIKNDLGMIEIISGVSGGEQVVIGAKK